jgi:SRSO17 transposase
LKGLFQSSKRNMERMSEVVAASDDQVLQNFLTHSSWDERAVMDRVAHQAGECFGGARETALYIDESGFEKKGSHSVGVARQWNGRLGKVDNCQVGVFAALGRGDRAALIDARLFLPKEWVDSPERCKKADIPTEHQVYRSKIELALEMVRHARANGVGFEWVGMDGLYGNAPHLLQALDDEGEIFMADVHSDQTIYLQDPVPTLPEKKSAKGRAPTRYHSAAEPQRVDKWVKQQPETAWKIKTLRNATKGKLKIEVLHRRVWVWAKGEAKAREWHLIVRREKDNRQEIKYSLSNAPASTSIAKLARMQGQRYWIERAFQDAKSHLGMAQYQARKWHSWHRHMALVMMASLFMVEQRTLCQKEFPLLSCYDIQIILARVLPSKQSDIDSLLAQMNERHQRRQQSIDYHRRKSSGAV